MYDFIWDDGEAISWDSITEDIERRELRIKYPYADLMLIRLFEDLVDNAQQYNDITNRHLPIYGELGEIFAEIVYGLKRHKPNAQGSDGILNKKLVEVKTISPFKKDKKVEVKREGNFEKLIIVKIDEYFEFEAKVVDRKEISQGNGGKVATVSWSSIK